MFFGESQISHTFSLTLIALVKTLGFEKYWLSLFVIQYLVTLALVSSRRNTKSRAQTSIFTIENWVARSCQEVVLSPLKNKCVLHVGAREAGYIKMGPKIDDVGS